MREPASRRRRKQKQMPPGAFAEKNRGSDLLLKLFNAMQGDAAQPEKSQLAHVILAWISEPDLDASRTFLEDHPALVDNTGTQVLEELLVVAYLVGDAQAIQQLQLHRIILAVARDMVIEATYAALAGSMASGKV
jgi:hypothetical protein